MWLDVTARRREAIPSRDLAVGIAIGMGLCIVSAVLVASMDLRAAPEPEEPLTVSIGVLPAASAPSGSAGAGGPTRSGKPGKRGRRAAPTDATSHAEPAPTPSHAPSTSHPRSFPDVPAPPGEPLDLPGLGDLGEPSAEPGEGGDPESPGEGNGTGTGTGTGEGDGGLGAYRAQLAAWLAANFHVEGSGLGPTALGKLRVRAVLELSEDRVVLSYQLKPSSNAVIDDAARRALEAVKGSTAPAPPPGLGPLQRRLEVVLVCRPDTCN